MAYVEMLRVRRTLAWYGAIAAIVTATALLGILGNPHDMHIVVGDGASGSAPSPTAVFVLTCGYFTAIVSTILGPSLNRENDGVEIVWTKPLAREWIALRYMLVDAVGLLAAFAIAVTAIGLIVHFALRTHGAGLGSFVSVGPHTALVVALSLGVVVMWYGLIQALTSWRTGKGGMVAGLSWAAVFLLLFLGSAPLPPVFHGITVALNFLNPLAYLSVHTAAEQVAPFGGFGPHDSGILPLALGARIALSWLIGLAGCAIAIIGWKRMEI